MIYAFKRLSWQLCGNCTINGQVWKQGGQFRHLLPSVTEVTVAWMRLMELGKIPQGGEKGPPKTKIAVQRSLAFLGLRPEGNFSGGPYEQGHSCTLNSSQKHHYILPSSSTPPPSAPPMQFSECRPGTSSVM